MSGTPQPTPRWLAYSLGWLLLAGCASPLGADWSHLDERARRDRAADIITGVLEGRDGGTPTAIQPLAVTGGWIVYRDLPSGHLNVLFTADIEGIEHMSAEGLPYLQDLTGLPRPDGQGVLLLYLRPKSPSVVTARAILPSTHHLILQSPHIIVDPCPHEDLERFSLALEHLGRSREPARESKLARVCLSICLDTSLSETQREKELLGALDLRP